MVKLRKNVEFYGSDEELTWKIPAVGKSVDELYEEKERKLYIDLVLKKAFIGQRAGGYQTYHI